MRTRKARTARIRHLTWTPPTKTAGMLVAGCAATFPLSKPASQYVQQRTPYVPLPGVPAARPGSSSSRVKFHGRPQSGREEAAEKLSVLRPREYRSHCSPPMYAAPHRGHVCMAHD
eukprot:221475-Chlamydomonas_euryale.AAC.17